MFPELADDTYATIGLSGPASTSGIAGAADPSIVEDANQAITPYFLTPGATNLESTTLTGASWYVLNTAANGLPDADMRVLIMQVTTTGDISGQMNYQVFPLGVGADQVQLSVPFDGTERLVEEELKVAQTAPPATTIPVRRLTTVRVPGSIVTAYAVVLQRLTPVASATVLARFTTAAVLTLQPAIAIASSQLDALGECGPCEADADADGTCDDVDDCIGALDACGICNGPGAIYDCGCSDIPAGDCDCDGNQPALGGRGGPCAADANGNGVCDDAELRVARTTRPATTTVLRLKTTAHATTALAAVGEVRRGLPLVVESSPAAGTPGTVYRFYVQMQDATDRMSAVFGNDQASLLVSTPDGAFNSTFNSSWNASGINPAFVPVFPELADDTYATIGLTGLASTSGIAATDPSIVEDANQAIPLTF